MRLYPSITSKNTIQYNNWSCYFCASTKEKKIITFDITTIKKYLMTRFHSDQQVLQRQESEHHE